MITRESVEVFRRETVDPPTRLHSIISSGWSCVIEKHRKAHRGREERGAAATLEIF